MVVYNGRKWLWWPIKSPNNGRNKIVEGSKERKIRSSVFTLDLKDGKL